MGVAGFHAMPADATMPGQEKIEWVKAGLLVQWATTEMDPSRRANAWFCSVGGERLSSEYVGHVTSSRKSSGKFLETKTRRKSNAQKLPFLVRVDHVGQH